MLRRTLRWTALALLAAALISGVSLWWLLGSGGGRDLILDQAIAALPEGQLRIGAREGSVAGGLRLRDLSLIGDGWRVDIDRLEASPRRPAISTRTLAFQRVLLSGVRITLSEASEPSPPFSWPESLPNWSMPFALRIDDFDLRDLRMNELRVDALAASLRLSSGEVVLEALQIDAPQGQMRGELHYAAQRRHALAALLGVTLREGATAQIKINGDLDAGEATLDGELGGPVALRMDWTGAGQLDTLSATLKLDATTLQPGTAGLGGPSIDALQLRLRTAAADADADADADANVTTPMGGLAVVAEGLLRQGEQTVLLRESALRVDATQLQAAPLRLSVLDGELDAQGYYRFADGVVDARLSAESLAWGEGASRVTASGEASVTGHAADWNAAFDLNLTRDRQQAKWVGRVQGDASTLRLAPFRLSTPGGALEGEGRYALDDSGVFEVQAQMLGIDPAWLAPDWPGRLDGRLRAEGALPTDGDARWTLRLDGLAGVLRGQSLSGDLALDAEGERLSAEADLMLGEGRLRADGAVLPQLALSVDADALAIGPWIKGASGVLDGQLRLDGALAAPGINADVVLLDGRWQERSVQRMALSGRLPATGQGQLTLRAENLADPALRVAAIELQLEGAFREGRFLVSADGLRLTDLPPLDAAGDEQLRAEGAWRLENEGERGEVELSALGLRLTRLPDVQLLGPTAIAWGASSWSFKTPACLSVGAKGRLCAEGDAVDLRLDGRDLDLAALRPFLPEPSASPWFPRGLASIVASRRQGPDGPVARLRIESASMGLAVGQVDPESVFEARDVLLEAEQSEGWRVTLGARLVPDGRLEARAEAAVDGTLTGLLEMRVSDLSLLEVLSADLADARGVIEGQMLLSGTVEAPRLSGRVGVSPLSVELPALGIAIVDGELSVEGQEDGALRLSGRLPTGDGVLALDGEWTADARPDTLRIQGSDVRILDTPDARVWVSPDLAVALEDGLARVRGTVSVPRADLRLDRFEQAASVSSDVVVMDDLKQSESAAMLALDADFQVTLGEAVRLRGYGFDGRLSGELQIIDAIDRAPRARGSLTLDGGLVAYGQNLVLTQGLLRWSNGPIGEPSIDVRAERPDFEPRVGVAVTGTADAPIFNVWSQPAMPQAEALSWLMFGRPLAAADGEDAAQLQQAATSLGGSAVAQALAGRVGLDTASVGQSRALGGTAVTVGKRITPKLYVSYGLALSGTGQVVSVTYALRRWLALKLESAEEQRVELEARFERD